MNQPSAEDVEFSRIVCVKTSKTMIHLDKLDDGTWRLIYSGGTEGIANAILKFDKRGPRKVDPDT